MQELQELLAPRADIHHIFSYTLPKHLPHPLIHPLPQLNTFFIWPVTCFRSWNRRRARVPDFFLELLRFWHLFRRDLKSQVGHLLTKAYVLYVVATMMQWLDPRINILCDIQQSNIMFAVVWGSWPWHFLQAGSLLGGRHGILYFHKNCWRIVRMTGEEGEPITVELICVLRNLGAMGDSVVIGALADCRA